MQEMLEKINQVVWGIPALICILGVGIYFTIRTYGGQFRLFSTAVHSFIQKLSSKPVSNMEISGFQALCTALAATVGTGNIAGVAGAIALGGPGAVFWMWVSGLIGMGTKLAEATLAVYYRKETPSGFIGGPMIMIERGMGSRWKWLGSLYSLFGVVAAFGVGNATQINAVLGSINVVVRSAGGEESMYRNLIIGAICAVLVCMLLLGGVGKIGRFTERLMPFASVIYIFLCLGAIICQRENIVSALQRILRGAFSPQAVTGGVVGSAFLSLRVGVSRGVFTNEAGMGTAGIAHAGASVTHSVEQGLMGIVEVFLDTIVVCTMTALVILTSEIEIKFGIDEGVLLAGRAFAYVYGPWVHVALSGLICCFAFGTVIGWGLYGLRCAQYLFGDNAWRVFAVVQAFVVMASILLKTGTVWAIAETVNGLMAIPNLIALLVLSPVYFRLINEYTQSNHGQLRKQMHSPQQKPNRAFVED